MASAVMMLAISCSNHGGGSNVIDSLPAGEPFRLCEQVLTSETALSAIADTTSVDYDREETPMDKAFLFLDSDLRDYPRAMLAQRRYNLNAVCNHVVHSFELFCRKSSSMEMQNAADTLELVSHDIVPISPSLLREALPDSRDRKAAQEFLAAYDAFDGHDEPGSALGKGFEAFGRYFSAVPVLASDELLDEFKENFWEWYDKKRYVSCIDEIQKLRAKEKASLTEEQLAHFRQAVESEADVDRRAILALEYAKWDTWGGALLLGEILESGQYTRYLLETWLTWRASVQMSRIGPSSFCIIPNNYYDMLRVRCMKTMLHHMQQSGDKYEICMLENLLLCNILHRQGSIMGNESMKTLSALQYRMFVHPRVLEEDKGE